MSKDPSRQIEHELHECIIRRKRKLREVYAVSSGGSLGAAFLESNIGLENFLDANDIEQGRYFHESTLPPRPNYAAAIKSSLLSQKSYESIVAQLSSPIGDKDASRETATDDLLSAQHVTRDTSGIPNDHDSERLASPLGGLGPDRQHIPNAALSSTPGSYSEANKKNTSSYKSTPTTPRHAHASLPRKSPHKLASPPYSPDSQAARAEFEANQGVNIHPKEPVNILTPAGESQEGISPSRSASTTESGQHVGRNGIRTPKSSGSSDDLDALEATAAVPITDSASSLGPGRALELADGPQTQDNGQPDGLSKVEAQIDSAKDVGTVNGVLPHAARSTAPDHTDDIAGTNGDLLPTETSKVSENNLRTDTIPGTLQPKPLDPNIATTQPERLQIEAFAKETEKIPDVSRERSPTPMEVDEVLSKLTRPTTSKEPSISKRSSNRVRKSRRKPRRRTTVVLANAKDERNLETIKSVRKNQGFPDYGTMSYYKPLFKRVVLSAANGFKTLDELLRNTTKSITTGDHLVSIREETDMRILERVRRLQSLDGRWSLKTPKAAVEPPSQESHWDLLMRDVKWLRTDFREERKLKIAVTKQLADWCAEWVNADSAERWCLQCRPGKVQHSANAQPVLEHTDVLGLSTEDDSLSSVENVLDLSLDAERPPLKRIKLDQALFNSIPQYGTNIVDENPMHTFRVVASADVDLEDPVLPTTVKSDRDAQGLIPTVLLAQNKDRAIDPEDVTCALFNPESRPLRGRLNAPWAFKPPSVPMPPQAFFEHRNASQWSWEDDQMLKQYAKDFPSNWGLIADRLNSRSMIVSYVDRRTPWECYERLLGMEGPPSDAQAKQYLRHFHARIERAKETFEAHQATLREHAEQQARTNGQPVPHIQPKRFPAPLRVERKPNKRFIAILDGSRKMAKKRENQAIKQQQQATAQTEAQQKTAQPQGRATQTPQYWSKLKYEREVREQERVAHLRDQQRVLLEQQRRQGGAQQPPLVNGVGQQQMRPGTTGNVQAQSINAPTMPGMLNTPNPAQQQALQQMAMRGGLNGIAGVNGMNGMNAQQASALNNRAQAQIAQQRLAPQLGGTPANAQEAMLRMAQQQRAMAQAGQPGFPQGQFARPAQNTNMGVSGTASAGMVNQFSNVIRSPGLQQQQQQQQQQNSSTPRISPQNAQVNLHNGQTLPQSLSSGHVPPIVNLQHQIRASNPNMSQQDVNRQAAEQLRMMTQNGAQNAMSGSQNSMNNNALANAFTQQQLLKQLQTNNIYGQNNNMLGNSQQRAAAAQVNQARSAGSPQNGSAQLAGTPQQQQQQLHGQQPQQQGQQSQYSAQLRQQMFNNQQRAITNQQAAAAAQGTHRSPSAQQGSPAMNTVMPVGPVAAGGFQRPQGPTTPGVNPGAQGTMRPPSRTPSSMGVNVNQGQMQHISPQQQLSQLHMQQQQMQRTSSGNSNLMGTPTPQMMQRTISGHGQHGLGVPAPGHMQRTISGNGFQQGSPSQASLQMQMQGQGGTPG